MPRAYRRKRKKEKQLAETAKKMRKLTSFFGCSPAKQAFATDDVDSGTSNSTLPSTTGSLTHLSDHSDHTAILHTKTSNKIYVFMNYAKPR